MFEINARGLNCPQPVILTKKALAEHHADVRVIVDNAPASENVSRFLKGKGYTAEITTSGNDFIVTGHGEGIADTGSASTTEAPVATGRRNAVFISHNVLGGDDKELGEVLIKAFLGTLTQYDDADFPEVIGLMNEGVKLALKGTSTAEILQDYLDKGGKLLVCGTCLNHFGLMDELGVGIVSNMFEISEAMLQHNTLCM